jgi:hypothetical protein
MQPLPPSRRPATGRAAIGLRIDSIETGASQPRSLPPRNRYGSGDEDGGGSMNDFTAVLNIIDSILIVAAFGWLTYTTSPATSPTLPDWQFAVVFAAQLASSSSKTTPAPFVSFCVNIITIFVEVRNGSRDIARYLILCALTLVALIRVICLLVVCARHPQRRHRRSD